MNRFQKGEKVIVRVSMHGYRTGDERDVDQFLEAVISGDGPEAGYHVLTEDDVSLYFTFYDVAPYDAEQLRKLQVQSQVAQDTLNHLKENWKWGKP